ncbi:hypothetical protein [Planctomyces sp. SH-PL14]|uniref:hypothetical protein n=1 Tax=Planctomyces sp. SH-PL14 TaxID=1632864 RepID=UPI00078BF58F|nr:hypothetical protein [Planctomyces sp. SH-PL14]AMV17413.1 hypothetical protein VT03_05945 [Planctomyces sp. SH-PL14]
MARSFSLVDDKLEEAAFFFEQLAATPDFFEARCYFSAFVAAARSVTFSLQAVMADLPGFADWYATKQAALKADPLARFFRTARTESQHIGVMHLNGGVGYRDAEGNHRVEHRFCSTSPFEPLPGAPEGDVAEACREYLVSITAIIHECYRRFGSQIDPEQYYTAENMRRLGKTLEEFTEELGFPREWLRCAPNNDEEQIMRVLRGQAAPSGIDGLFLRYLGKDRLTD